MNEYGRVIIGKRETNYARFCTGKKDRKTVLIEVNNTCSLGSYGLYCVNYAKLLSARWAELRGTEDECNFLLSV